MPTRRPLQHIIIRFADGTERMFEFPNKDVYLASTDAVYMDGEKVLDRKRQHRITWEEDDGEDKR